MSQTPGAVPLPTWLVTTTWNDPMELAHESALCSIPIGDCDHVCAWLRRFDCRYRDAGPWRSLPVEVCLRLRTAGEDWAFLDPLQCRATARMLILLADLAERDNEQQASSRDSMGA